MKKILILGGSSDIGKELIKKILKDNDYLIHAHYNNNKLDKIFTNKIKTIKADILKLNEKNILKKFDSDYDIIINLIGYISDQSFLNFDIKELQNTINANSIIPLIIIRNNLKHMIKNKFGRIINTSSIGIKFGGGEHSFSYSLSKHVNEFIPNYLRNLCSKNILYNTVRIGVTDTKFHKKINHKSMTKRIDLIPIKKHADKKDIANYIFFLIKNNNFITNEIINITGGE